MNDRLEKMFVGGILHDPSRLPDAMVRPEDLSDPLLASLLSAIDELRVLGEKIDPMIIGAHTGSSTMEMLAFECLCETPTAEMAVGWGKQILAAKCDSGIRKVLEDGLSSDLRGPDLAAYVQASIGHVDMPAIMSTEHVSKGLHRTLDRLETISKTDEGLGIKTGLGKLDEVLGGIQRGLITVIAGRPSLGKSAMSAIIALQSGVRVGYWTLEDKTTLLNCRMISQISQVNLERIIAADLSANQWSKVNGAAAQIANMPIFVDDKLPQDAGRFLLNVERTARKERLELGVIDYFQLLRMANTGGRGRADELGYISNGLAGVADRTEMGLIVCAQLNRKADEDSEPQLHHLKDCGTLEQDAYAVIMLGKRKPADTIADVFIRKNKNGRTGLAKIGWERECVRFFDAEERYEYGRV